MRTENYTGPLPVWKKLSRKLPFVAIGLIALYATSCKSPATGMATSSLTDSLHQKRKVEFGLLPVPMSRVTLTLPPGAIEALPPDAAYTDRNGQATVTLRKGMGDTLVVTATCDSLARQYLLLQEEFTRLRSATETQYLPPATVNEPTGWQWFFIRLGQLAAAGLVLYLIIYFINIKKL